MDNDPTIVDFVKKYWPTVNSQEEIETILWELTAYPFATLEILQRQIETMYTRSGGDVALAWELNWQDIQREMIQFRKRYENGEFD